MKKNTLTILLLTVVALFGFCDFAQAVRVKFVFPQSVSLQIITEVTETKYDNAGLQIGDEGRSRDYFSLDNPSEWVDLEDVNDLREKYEVDGNDLTIDDRHHELKIVYSDGFYRVVSYRYYWNYKRNDDEFEGGDITDQVVDGATIDLTKNFPAEYIVTVNIVDTDGTPQDDVEVTLRPDEGYNYYRESTVNGKAVFTLLEGTYHIIEAVDAYDEYEIDETIEVSKDMTVTYTLPKLISFDVMINGMTLAQIYDSRGGYDEDASLITLFSLDYRNRHSIRYKGGKVYSRLDPNQEYRVYYDLFRVFRHDDFGYVKGTTKISDGSTIRIATFNVQTDGEGLAFPRDEFAGNSSYYVFVGNPVRLAAVPVGDSKFVSWTINGKENTNAMIDFTVKDDITTATAKFSGEIVNQVKTADSSIENISVVVDGNYLVLPTDLDATASLYATDGRLVKRTGVVGNKINICDLPTGAYILSLTANGKRQNAQFVK